ncbi:unnamed protein product, partial [Rotaria magnacalcarata]
DSGPDPSEFTNSSNDSDKTIVDDNGYSHSSSDEQSNVIEQVQNNK